MKNQSFSHSSLARNLQSEDFHNDILLNDDSYRDRIIEESVGLADSLFKTPLSVVPVAIGLKQAYSIQSLQEKLVVRRCLENLKNSIPLPLKHRSRIARELVEQFKEGTSFRVYRLDIKQFFESIKVEDVKTKLESLNGVSIHTRNLINSYLDCYVAQFNVLGLPRGIEVSPFLSDLMMLDFDNEVKQHGDVFYYTRFVDDIIIITSAYENQKQFMKWLRSELPGVLSFNHNKQEIQLVENSERGPKTPPVTVSFLGYEYTITNSYDTNSNKRKQKVKKEFRDVKINISSNKIKNIKTKIAKSFYSHHKKPDIDLLFDRLFFLTSNRELLYSKNKKKIPTGIFYNFSMLTPEAKSLLDLDLFLVRTIKRNSTRLETVVNSSLSASLCQTLFKLSFRKGFTNRIFKTFNPQRLREMTKIW